MDYERPKNPFQLDHGWFWYDETKIEYGPYNTYELAKADLERYCKEFLYETDCNN